MTRKRGLVQLFKEDHTQTGCRFSEGEWELDSSSRVDIQQQLEQPDSSYRTQQAGASQSVSSCWGGWGAAQEGGRCDNKTSGRRTTEEWTEEESNSTENYAEVRKGWGTRTLMTELNQGKKGGVTSVRGLWDTYPAGAAALTFGKEQRRTLQNRPGGGPVLSGEQKRK